MKPQSTNMYMLGWCSYHPTNKLYIQEKLHTKRVPDQFVLPWQYKHDVQFCNCSIITANGKLVNAKCRSGSINGKIPFPIERTQQLLLIPPTDNGAAIVERLVQCKLDLNNLPIEDEFTLLMLGAEIYTPDEETQRIYFQNTLQGQTL